MGTCSSGHLKCQCICPVNPVVRTRLSPSSCFAGKRAGSEAAHLHRRPRAGTWARRTLNPRVTAASNTTLNPRVTACVVRGFSTALVLPACPAVVQQAVLQASVSPCHQSCRHQSVLVISLLGCINGPSAVYHINCHVTCHMYLAAALRSC